MSFQLRYDGCLNHTKAVDRTCKYLKQEAITNHNNALVLSVSFLSFPFCSDISCKTSQILQKKITSLNS